MFEFCIAEESILVYYIITMEDLLSNTYFKRSGLIDKQIEGYTVIFDEMEAEVLKLNESASRIWQLICARNSIEDIVKIMINDFCVEEKSIRKDVSGFIRQLLSLGLIEAYSESNVKKESGVIDYE